MILEHTYYIAYHRQVCGSHPERHGPFLFATFCRLFPIEHSKPGMYDGVSLIVRDGGEATVRATINGISFDVR